MPLFLPRRGWHVRFVADWDDLADKPLPAEDVSRFNADFWIEDEYPDELVLNAEFDPKRLQGHPSVKAVKEVWFIGTEDKVNFPDEPRGREIEVCAGTTFLYTKYDQVMADLASCNEDIASVWAMAKKGPAAARPLAKAVLDGDLATLGVLADLLEELGHKDAAALRKVAADNPVKAGKKKKAKAPAAATKAEVVLVGGYPGAGKSTLAKSYTERGFARLNRDDIGGTIDALAPKLDALLAEGRSVVLDNLFPTFESRGGVVEAAKKHGASVKFIAMGTTLEDAQFNVCLRMMEKCGRVLGPEDHKKPPFKNDISLYPVLVLYRYRKELEAATTKEGFDAVETHPFTRNYPPEWTNRALILDFDGTLRTHEGAEKYPLKPSEVRAFKERAAKLREYRDKGYLLLGASNQSGVAKGLLTRQDAEDCFAETQEQLGVRLDEVKFCPHGSTPISCYCRKPGPGMGVELIVKYNLDPRRCVYVGDMTTDKSFARRCGFTFVDQGEFFSSDQRPKR